MNVKFTKNKSHYYIYIYIYIYILHGPSLPASSHPAPKCCLSFCLSLSLSLSSSVQFVIGFNGKEMCNLTGVAVEPTTSVFILSLTRPCLDKIPWHEPQPLQSLFPVINITLQAAHTLRETNYLVTGTACNQYVHWLRFSDASKWGGPKCQRDVTFIVA